MSAARQGLKRNERLKKKSEYDAAYASGKRLQGRLFITYVLPRPGGPLRVGVVASRRLGGAVERNRAKRLLREVFRTCRPEARVSADVVIIARESINRVRFADVRKAYASSVLPHLGQVGEGVG